MRKRLPTKNSAHQDLLVATVALRCGLKGRLLDHPIVAFSSLIQFHASKASWKFPTSEA